MDVKTKILTALITAMFSAGVTAGTLTTPFTPGTGNSSDNFLIDTSGDVEVGIKAKARKQGDIPLNGTTYAITAGLSEGLANWNIDFSFNLGSLWEAEGYILEVALDFDPSPETDFVSIVGPAEGQIVQGSQNPSFGFWQFFATGTASDAVAAFDPLLPGLYGFYASVVNADGVEVVRSQGAVNVSAVPLPAGAWLFLSAVGAAAGLRRARRIG